MDRISDKQNVDLLVDRIIERNDPLRNTISSAQRDIIRAGVEKFLRSWKQTGKFDQNSILVNGYPVDTRVISTPTLIELYNKEFVESFSEAIFPSNSATKVKSVLNPNGMYAQQSRVINFNPRSTPFYERALYRRLVDRNMELPLNESESPFYRLDFNPRMSDTERRKREPSRSELPLSFDRENLHYSMAS